MVTVLCTTSSRNGGNFRNDEFPERYAHTFCALLSIPTSRKLIVVVETYMKVEEPNIIRHTNI